MRIPLMVGRDEERSHIDRFLDVAAGAQPEIVVLDGRAGIGKTTLWRHGQADAQRRGLRVLAATAAESETRLAFATLGDLLAGEICFTSWRRLRSRRSRKCSSEPP